MRQLSGDPVLGELMVMNYRAAELSVRHRAMACGQPILGGALDGTDQSSAKVVLFLAEETQAIMHHKLHGVVQHLVESTASQRTMEPQALMDLLDANLAIYPLGGHSTLARMGECENEFRELSEQCAGARLIVFDPLRQFVSRMAQIGRAHV